MSLFSAHTAEIRRLVSLWKPKLLALPAADLSTRFNSQHRILKMIVGPLFDSASNNTHRSSPSTPSPLHFPDCANLGNNDRWIALQGYQHEPWRDLVYLWKSTTLHFAYMAERVDETKLENVGLNGLGESVTLERIIRDYGRHLGEVEELINCKMHLQVS